MSSIQQDLSIFNKFNFKLPPVGVKYLFDKPEAITRLDKNLALCELLREAQERTTPFYVDLDNLACAPSAYVWGQDVSKVFKSGHFGVELEYFKDPSPNRKVYQYLPRIAPEGVVNYIAFAPISQLSFYPDLFIIFTDTASQTEIVLRAMSYSTGQIWSSEMSGVLGCAWIFAYPYVSGEVNYMVTGLGLGMKSRRVFPEGHQIISIPYNWLPIITQNLQEMQWVLPAYSTDDLQKFIERIYTDLGIPVPGDSF